MHLRRNVLINLLLYNFSFHLLAFLKSKYSLQDALLALSEMKTGGKQMKQLSNYILKELENGSSLANILLANPIVWVPKRYRQLMASEEKTGDYKKTLEYICKTEEEKKETIREYLKLSMYPLFIILLCFTGSFVFGNYTKSISNIKMEDLVFRGLFYANMFLVFFLLFFSFIMYLCHRKSEKIILLICLNFFLENSYDLTRALEYTGALLKENSKLKADLQKLITNLHFGMPVIQAFSAVSLFSQEEIKKIERAVLLGHLGDGIKNVLENLENKSKTLKQIFGSFVEPFLIMGAGIYLLIIIMQAILPFFLLYGGLL